MIFFRRFGQSSRWQRRGRIPSPGARHGTWSRAKPRARQANAWITGCWSSGSPSLTPHTTCTSPHLWYITMSSWLTSCNAGNNDWTSKYSPLQARTKHIQTAFRWIEKKRFGAVQSRTLRHSDRHTYARATLDGKTVCVDLYHASQGHLAGPARVCRERNCKRRRSSNV